MASLYPVFTGFSIPNPVLLTDSQSLSHGVDNVVK